MIFSTVPGMVVLGRSGTRARSKFRSAILADLAMRGFAISFLTLARIESLCSFLLFLGFLDFLCSMLPSSRRSKSGAAPFRTLANLRPYLCLGDLPPRARPRWLCEVIDHRRCCPKIALAAKPQRRVEIGSFYIVHTSAHGYGICHRAINSAAYHPGEVRRPSPEKESAPRKGNRTTDPGGPAQGVNVRSKITMHRGVEHGTSHVSKNIRVTPSALEIGAAANGSTAASL